jgi:tRNA-Thr(GGU) m(6)t(6)A37 methyltransferase TsaA
MPIQAVAAVGVCGTVEVFPEFADGLNDLAGFSHIILLYHFHLAGKPRLRVVPFLDSQPRGIFATRAPARPNPIGFSVVKLVAVDARGLDIENVDMADQTPLLDIKPYVPKFDHRPADRIGWLASAEHKVTEQRSDERFR